MREVPLVLPWICGLWNVFTIWKMAKIRVLARETQADFCFWTLNKRQGNHCFRKWAVKFAEKEVSPRNKVNETTFSTLTSLGGRRYDPHFANEEAEAQSGWMTSPKLLGWWGMEPKHEPISTTPQTCSLLIASHSYCNMWRVLLS